MAYRNGTYIAFYAGGTTDPTASDIKYYRTMKMWHANGDIDFRFVNSHEKASAVRDSSKKETLRRSLCERLNHSKNFVLIVGDTTKSDTDWVPFEISYAVAKCGIPIIAAYTGFQAILKPAELSYLWPAALADRIRSGAAKVLHIPFKQRVIDTAIRQFHLNNLPQGSLVYYTLEAHRVMGVSV